MFIKNLQFDATKHYVCNNKIAKYLNQEGLSEISYFDNKFIFINNNDLQEALKNMPFYLRLFK